MADVEVRADAPARNPQYPDLIGQTFNLLTVEACAGHSSLGVPRWLARCTCGNTKEISDARLRRGLAISCGCVKAMSRQQPGLAMAGRKPLATPVAGLTGPLKRPPAMKQAVKQAAKQSS